MKKLILSGLLLIFSLGLSARDDDAPQDTLSAEFHDDHIDMSDGRELQFVKHVLPHPGSQLDMLAPSKAKVSIRYADGSLQFLGKVPFVYKVPSERINQNFWLVVDEGGPVHTWQLELYHESGYALEISSEE